MTLVDNAAITIRSPGASPLSFVGLELVVLGLAGLTLAHAVRAHRAGDRAALLTWTTIFVYGLAMEVLSYEVFDNFAHGQFTVMFYDRQLPLYVTAIYPVLLYAGIASARRLGLPAPAEAVAAGLLIVAMDAPFDVMGPAAGWWRWFDDDPNLAYRWLGVPVTSYFWHFAFGGLLAYLTALAARRSRRPAGPSLALVPALAVATVVLGVLSFAPFHALKAAGVSDGVIVGGALAAAALAITVTARAPVPGRDRGLAAMWLVFYGYHVGAGAALAAGGGADWGRRLAFVATIATAAGVLALGAGRRRAPVSARAA